MTIRSYSSCPTTAGSRRSRAKGTRRATLPLRAGKGWLYEGGVREPMIVQMARNDVKAGSTCDEPVISTDFYPTMLEIAGSPVPGLKQHVDGLQHGVPLLAQPRKASSSDALYWHYPALRQPGSGNRPGGAVRVGDYKLIEFYEDNRAGRVV